MWEEKLTERERLWRAMETLDNPATVSDIAAEADVAPDNAENELKRMLSEGRVRQHEADGEVTYFPSLTWMLFNEIRELIRANSREELESRLIDYQSRIESFQSDYDATSSTELRHRLVERSLTATEMQEVRDAASKWSLLESERRLIKHALYLYEDVTRLAISTDDPTFPL